MAGASIVILAILAQTSTVGTNAEDKSKAQGLLVEGANLYQKGNYLGALDRFNAAYAVYPSSKIWFNIGLANRDLGREVEAREAFRRFLDEVPNASRENRADVQAWLSDIEKRLGQLTITCAVSPPWSSTSKSRPTQALQSTSKALTCGRWRMPKQIWSSLLLMPQPSMVKPSRRT